MNTCFSSGGLNCLQDWPPIKTLGTVTLKQASLNTNTAHALLQFTAGGRYTFFVTTHAPRETTLEPVSGFLQTLSDVLFSPCESPFAIINHTYEYNCLQVLGVLLVSHQREVWVVAGPPKQQSFQSHKASLPNLLSDDYMVFPSSFTQKKGLDSCVIYIVCKFFLV